MVRAYRVQGGGAKMSPMGVSAGRPRHAGDEDGYDHGVPVRCARRTDGTAGVDRGVGEADEEWTAYGCGGVGAGGGGVTGGDEDRGGGRGAYSV